MTSALGENLPEAFAVAAGELGMFSAAALFTATVQRTGGAQLVGALRDGLGERFPVLDAVTSRVLEDGKLAEPDVEEVVAACAGLKKLLVVGLEAVHLDALLPRLPAGTKVGIIPDHVLPIDVRRVQANYASLATLCTLTDVQRFAGSRSGLLTFVYGSDGFRAAVPGVWLRVVGSDVRTTFRTLIGWNILGSRMTSYPRWLRETSIDDFSVVAGGGA